MSDALMTLKSNGTVKGACHFTYITSYIHIYTIPPHHFSSTGRLPRRRGRIEIAQQQRSMQSGFYRFCHSPKIKPSVWLTPAILVLRPTPGPCWRALPHTARAERRGGSERAHQNAAHTADRRTHRRCFYPATMPSAKR